MHVRKCRSLAACSVEHVISKSLGTTEYFLKTGVVCERKVAKGSRCRRVDRRLFETGASLREVYIAARKLVDKLSFMRSDICKVN